MQQNARWFARVFNNRMLMASIKAPSRN